MARVMGHSPSSHAAQLQSIVLLSWRDRLASFDHIDFASANEQQTPTRLVGLTTTGHHSIRGRHRYLSRTLSSKVLTDIMCRLGCSLMVNFQPSSICRGPPTIIAIKPVCNALKKTTWGIFWVVKEGKEAPGEMGLIK